ncbi:MAG: M48 family metallopeptidase [Candidatus Omnitrophica bacterium]|nr:M48 family metallopeptidase [Candidatus Omnitrophota bacterium]
MEEVTAGQRPYQIQTHCGDISYFLRRSRRRRTIEISIGGETSRVKVSAPTYTSHNDIQNFIRKKTEWIIEKIKEAEVFQQTLEARQYAQGEYFLFLGKKHPIEIVQEGYIRKVLFEEERWKIRVPVFLSSRDLALDIKSQLVEWYRHQAQEILPGRVLHYAGKMSLQPSKIHIRNQKRIWGSCHPQNRNIHLNWRLVLTPMDVMDYVVVHELSHLLVPNHSKRFWQEVEKVLPDYPARQKWLKDHRMDLKIL